MLNTYATILAPAVPKSCLNCNCSRGEFFCSARFFLVKPQEALIKSSNLTIFSLSIMYFRHDDPDSTRNNTENECYCLQDEGFKCLPSGAMYMEPCKRADQAPVARFHVHGTCRHTFETFILQAITFNFAIVPCWTWVIVSTKQNHIVFAKFIRTLVILYHMKNNL